MPLYIFPFLSMEASFLAKIKVLATDYILYCSVMLLIDMNS